MSARRSSMRPRDGHHHTRTPRNPEPGTQIPDPRPCPTPRNPPSHTPAPPPRPPLRRCCWPSPLSVRPWAWSAARAPRRALRRLRRPKPPTARSCCSSTPTTSSPPTPRPCRAASSAAGPVQTSPRPRRTPAMRRTNWPYASRCRATWTAKHSKPSPTTRPARARSPLRPTKPPPTTAARRRSPCSSAPPSRSPWSRPPADRPTGRCVPAWRASPSTATSSTPSPGSTPMPVRPMRSGWRCGAWIPPTSNDSPPHARP